MTLLNTQTTSEEPGGRYGQFRLGENDVVVYDRENADAWLRTTPVALDA